MSANRKKLLIPDTMVKAGWDVLAGRDDVAAIRYKAGDADAGFPRLARGC